MSGKGEDVRCFHLRHQRRIREGLRLVSCYFFTRFSVLGASAGHTDDGKPSEWKWSNYGNVVCTVRETAQKTASYTGIEHMLQSFREERVKESL